MCSTSDATQFANGAFQGCVHIYSVVEVGFAFENVKLGVKRSKGTL